MSGRVGAIEVFGEDALQERAVCVVDFESRLSPDAERLVARADHAAMSRAMLLEVSAVSMLSFRTTAEGLSDAKLETIVDPAPERVMLLAVEQALTSLGAEGLLVTHNGVAHDLPLALRRSIRQWLFDLPSLWRYAQGGPELHFDTMLRFGGRGGGRAGGSLVDLCAGLGFSALVPATGRRQAVDPLLRKGQVDVVATAVAFLHWEAAKRRSPRWLAAAWRDLGRYLLTSGIRADHLMPIARRGMEIGDALALVD